MSMQKRICARSHRRLHLPFRMSHYQIRSYFEYGTLDLTGNRDIATIIFLIKKKDILLLNGKFLNRIKYYLVIFSKENLNRNVWQSIIIFLYI